MLYIEEENARSCLSSATVTYQHAVERLCHLVNLNCTDGEPRNIINSIQFNLFVIYGHWPKIHTIQYNNI